MIGDVVEEKGDDFIPPSWYTCSINLKRCIARAVVQEWDKNLHFIMKLPLFCEKGIIKSVYVNTIQIDGRPFVVGFGGKFTPNKLRKKHGGVYEARMKSYSRAVNCWDT